MPNKNIKKVLEFFIPAGYLLNDNVKNDYRSNMGKMKWLTDQVTMAVDNAECGYPENPKLLCWVEKKENLNIDPKHFGLVINHIKINNKAFDLCNYERTMKPPIDVLTANGYWDDDNCKVCNPIILIGGNVDDGIKDPFNMLTAESKDRDAILEHFGQRIPLYWFTKTKYTELKDYDLFQIYTIKY